MDNVSRSRILDALLLILPLLCDTKDDELSEHLSVAYRELSCARFNVDPICEFRVKPKSCENL